MARGTLSKPQAPLKRPIVPVARWLCCALLGLLAVLALLGLVEARQAGPRVHVVQVEGVIDLGLAPYLARVLEQAEREGARAVVLEINTPGGRLDAALQMRDALLGAQVPTVAFVNREAFSAGALIAIAANELYMAPGAVLGAATPVDSAGASADEKTISAVRATFRTTAELRGRDPQIAEAMVDPGIAIPGVVEAGQLLTLTTAEAERLGFVEGIVEGRQALLAAAGLEGAAVDETRPSLAEQLVRLLTNPAVASLLVAIGLLLILADVYSGGFGAVGGIGIALIALFFWGHALAGLAGWEGVALVVLGLLLIGLEAFVIPGFGVAGLAGIAALLGGLFISLIGDRIVTTEDLTRAAFTVVLTLALVILGAALLLRTLPRAARLQGLILQSQVGRAEAPARRRARRPWGWLEGQRLEAEMAETGPLPADRRSLVGATGVALSPLRPGGVAQIGSMRVDVVTRGDYIAAGEPVEVIADEGYRRVVRRREDGEEQT